VIAGILKGRGIGLGWKSSLAGDRKDRAMEPGPGGEGILLPRRRGLE